MYQRHPDDPEAINHLLNSTLFHELYRIGALSSGEYANDTFINAAHQPADRRVCDQIKSLVEKAFEIENQRLERDPKDVAALYTRGVTKAEFATYTALVEHAWFSALRNADITSPVCASSSSNRWAICLSAVPVRRRT